MKNSIIRLMSLILVIVMMVSSFASCVKKNPDGTGDNSQQGSGETENPSNNNTPVTPADIVKIEMSASASQI